MVTRLPCIVCWGRGWLGTRCQTLATFAASAGSPKRTLILHPFGGVVAPFTAVVSPFRTMARELGAGLDVCEGSCKAIQAVCQKQVSG